MKMGRIGEFPGNEQMGRGKRGLHMLTRIRNMPDDVYSMKRDKIESHYENKLKRHNLDEAEIQAKMETFTKTIDETRNLSDSEFEEKKFELASQIAPGGQDFSNFKVRGKNLKIFKALLNTDLIPVLENRIDSD